MHLSWANLHDCYFRHNRVLIEGWLNGNAATLFWSAQKNMLQKINAIVCPADNYDPAHSITTELGETYLSGAKASVKQAELSPSGLMKFDLLYGPADNVNTGVPDRKWILIYEDGCGVFHAILSEPADANLDFVIRYVIFNSDGSQLCNNGAGVTWTIPITSETDDYTIPAGACGPEDIPFGGCIWYLPHSFEIVGRPDWIVDLTKDTDCDCPGMSS
jgi:hypothetical protein